MLELFTHKPPRTDWVRCDLFVGYDCEAKPQVDDVVVRGLEQFGFIISHQYVIKAFVEEARSTECLAADCSHAIAYEFDIRFYVYNKVGLGFGFGHGTGTMGWTTKGRTHLQSFVTRCICCDRTPKVNRTRATMSSESPTAIVVSTAVVGAAIALASVNIEHPLARMLLDVAGALTGISLVGTAWRLLRARLGTDISNHSDSAKSEGARM